MSSPNIPKTMGAIDIKGGKGGISALFLNKETPVPKPTATQALVKIKAFGLNRMDLLQREGLYHFLRKPPPPWASEHERDFKIGSEVFGLAYGGAYAEYIAVSTHMLVHKPAELSWEEAAGVPETWITATQALWMIGGLDETIGNKATKDKRVLWHAGASGVSISGVQLALSEGVKEVLITTSSQEKIDFVKGFVEGGKEKVFGFRYNDPEKPWEKAVLEHTNGEGVDLIIDFIGGSYFNANLDAAAQNGRIVSLGTMGGAKADVPGGVDIGRFLRKRLRYEGSTLRARDEAYQGKLRDMLNEHALPRFKDGRFKVPMEKVFSWKDVQDAHRMLEANTSKGKIICVVD
ncbi:Quinone oxido PIG3 [Cyphellophora attinorum]|uniref:Quinone oxido PIG3 n=1 Tax=Cyphellophora attinorum TaxID=1664694 RepID=A0A0N1P155_9EURO|nr:Quinone oxido PIG3 [Phialophora attinorum]KPI40167.1 Quinone oxido PIG3 [Phialophora attinorum]